MKEEEDVEISNLPVRLKSGCLKKTKCKIRPLKDPDSSDVSPSFIRDNYYCASGYSDDVLVDLPRKERQEGARVVY